MHPRLSMFQKDSVLFVYAIPCTCSLALINRFMNKRKFWKRTAIVCIYDSIRVSMFLDKTLKCIILSVVDGLCDNFVCALIFWSNNRSFTNCIPAKFLNFFALVLRTRFSNQRSAVSPFGNISNSFLSDWFPFYPFNIIVKNAWSCRLSDEITGYQKPRTTPINFAELLSFDANATNSEWIGRSVAKSWSRPS